ncbi:hypothetical protein [Nannocystis sp.]|uniref:hypothetical protein n=1 Tax=Nannocystis sp. TaxID=1962667 RepID=UPI0025FED8E9|nr:hypothetical protein [Nannocystis sp.]MBK7830705.1 hypothetical protein [Nannocystis sp.]
MRAYVDCPGCSCLVGAGESSCPFCGHGLRSSTAPLWLALGLVFSLGTVSVSCADKEGDSVSESQGSNSYESIGVTYAGPDETSVTDPGGDSSSTDPNTTTTNPTADPTADASTYAGPDETTTTNDVTSSSEGSGSESSGTGSTGDSTGGTGESTGESSGGTGSTG